MPNCRTLPSVVLLKHIVVGIAPCWSENPQHHRCRSEDPKTALPLLERTWACHLDHLEFPIGQNLHAPELQLLEQAVLVRIPHGQIYERRGPDPTTE